MATPPWGKKPKSKMGRPEKLTPELQEEICDALMEGNYLEPAAHKAGVCKAAVYNWLKRGGYEKDRLRRDPKARPLKKEAKYIEFVDAVKKAEAQAEADDVRTIRAASKEIWQAAAWRLERKHFRRWGRKQAIEHTGEDGGALKSVVELQFYNKEEDDDGEGQ